MSVRYTELADYVAIAAAVTELDVERVVEVANLGLADSALHAPAAEFDETEFYPDFVDKAAVLVVRLTNNHPLPDGNKRAAWATMRIFVEVNGWSWSARPTVDDAERMMLAIASSEASEADVASWLRAHLSPPGLRA